MSAAGRAAEDGAAVARRSAQAGQREIAAPVAEGGQQEPRDNGRDKGSVWRDQKTTYPTYIELYGHSLGYRALSPG